MLHHSTEYRLNGGAWIEITPDEVAGSGKTFTISGLAPGSYNVEMRLTPLVGGGPSVVSDSFTLNVVSGSYAAQVQAVQSESSSGLLTFVATSTQSQNKNAEQVSSLLLFIGSVAQAQTVQSESGSTSSNILGSASESQLVQSESVSGIQTFSGSASQSQNKQINAATSAETFAGSVAASQNIQTSVIVSYETFNGTVAESQQKQVEAISSSNLLNISGTIAEGQTKQSESVVTVETFAGSIVEAQQMQSENILSSLVTSFAGTVAQSQAKQAEDGSNSVYDITDFNSEPTSTIYGGSSVQGWTVDTIYYVFALGGTQVLGSNLNNASQWNEDTEQDEWVWVGSTISKIFTSLASGVMSFKIQSTIATFNAVVSVNGVVTTFNLIGNDIWRYCQLNVVGGSNIIITISVCPTTIESGSSSTTFAIDDIKVPVP